MTKKRKGMDFTYPTSYRPSPDMVNYLKNSQKQANRRMTISFILIVLGLALFVWIWTQAGLPTFCAERYC